MTNVVDIIIMTFVIKENGMEKQSAIKQMYEKQRGHYESVPQSEKYRKCLDEVIKRDDEMREKLEKYPKLLELYQKASDAFWDLDVAYADDHYYEGFCFGVLMGLEIAGTR